MARLSIHVRARRGGMPLRVLVAMAFVALCLFFGTRTPAFAESRTVRVGLYENEPKIFTDPSTGEPAGIFVDLLEEIAQQEDWKLVWVGGTWDEDLDALETGRIDLMPDVAYSPERDALYDFHKTPVVESWSQIYASPGARLDRVSELNGKRVAVLRNSIQQSVLSQMAEGFGYDIDIVPAPTLKDAFQMVADGKVDAAVGNHLFGDYFYLRYGLQKSPIVFNAVPLYYATAQGRNADLLEAIDGRLDAWIGKPGSPYYETIDRYTRTEEPRGIPAWLLWVLGATVVLFAIASGLAVLLRWQVAVRTRDLKQAHEAVARAEETLRLAVDAAREGIFDWYPQTGRVVWTPRCYTMLGYEPDEFPMDYDRWAELLHPDDRERVASDLERIDTGDRSFDYEVRLLMKSGEFLWISSRGSAVTFDPEGNAERVVGTHMDISERKRAEEEVMRLNADLERRVEERTALLETAYKDLESFSYSVSHDLRAPLRAISGFAQIVARRHREGLNEEGQHYIDNIVQASGRMGDLIEDLLTYSRLGRQAVAAEPIALQGLASAVASDLAARVDEMGGVLEIAEDLPTIEGDRTLLLQVLTNLLDNAIAYRRPGVAPHVILGWKDSTENIVLSVKDNGIGIPAEYQDKVFNIFQRLHGDDEYPGTGIGLANVKKCVDMLSGSVWLESVVGEGTTFYVRLPKER